MKPVITHTDYHTLKSLVTNYPAHLISKEATLLVEELGKADVVDDQQIDQEVIRINSYFEAVDAGTGKMLKFTLTLPELANVKEQKISVFSPLGIALIGFRKGMSVQWTLPGGLKTIEILKVVNN